MRQEQVGEVTILSPHGSLLSDSPTGDDLHHLANALELIATEGRSDCLIDLSQVDLISSIGIAIFLSTSRKMEVNNQTLSFCNVTNRVASIFVIMRLSLVFTVYETRDEAITALFSARKPPP